MKLKHTHSRVYTQVNFLSFCFVLLFPRSLLDVISKPVLIGSNSAAIAKLYGRKVFMCFMFIIGKKCSFSSPKDNRKKINLANKLNGLKATRHYDIKDFDCTLFFLQSPSLHQSLQFSFCKAK